MTKKACRGSPIRTNAAAGLVAGALEPQITASRRLEYYTYFLLTEGRPAFDSHWASLEEMKRVWVSR